MKTEQNKRFISRRQAIGGLLLTGAALGTGLVNTPSAFASTHLVHSQPAPTSFKATIKTSQVALKHHKLSGTSSQASLKTYTLKTNTQAAPLAAQDFKATFASFPVKTSSDPGVGMIVKGDDGSSFWFVETNANRIGKITTQGAITEYNLPLSGYYPNSIANGPGSTFWFPYTTYGSNASYIGSLNSDSQQVTLYQLPIDINPNYMPSITRGPNNTLWFVSGSNQIGSITANGAVTVYTLSGVDWTYSITTGPDGALWFTYMHNDGSDTPGGAARFTTDGSLTLYPIHGDELPQITAGHNNDLWFTVAGGGNIDDRFIGNLTVNGQLTTYDVQSQLQDNSQPNAIAYLGNGAIAFGTNEEGEKTSQYQYVGTITSAGDVQLFETPNADQVISMVYAGWANEVWFTSTDTMNTGKDKIYKFRVTN